MPRLVLLLVAVAVLYAIALVLDSDLLLGAAGAALIFVAFGEFFADRGAADPAAVPRSAERARIAAGFPYAGAWLLGTLVLLVGAGELLGERALAPAALVACGIVGVTLGLARDRRVALRDPEVLPVHRRGALMLLLSSLGLGMVLAAIAVAGLTDEALAESLERLGGGLCALLVRELRDLRARPAPAAVAQA